ncbi:MAG: PepSY domain-containing protein [Aliarcobacter sp.]|jgi:uncharacterized membrane protein YkoI|nr:PepSY domain-containing protein [Aliarcobacter sp.]
MKKNSYFVKSIIGLSLIGTVLLANDIEINDDKKELDIKSSIQIKGDISELEEKISAKIDASDVIKIIKKEQNGKVINIDLENEDGNLVYKAEVLNDNIVTDFIIDAGNGQILNQQIDKSDNGHDKEEEENDDENEKDKK